MGADLRAALPLGRLAAKIMRSHLDLKKRLSQDLIDKQCVGQSYIYHHKQKQSSNDFSMECFLEEAEGELQQA